MDGCRDVPQYKLMKYLVFRIILSSLLSELQVMISKVDHNGVCPKQTEHSRGGLSLQTLSSEERLEMSQEMCSIPDSPGNTLY